MHGLPLGKICLRKEVSLTKTVKLNPNQIRSLAPVLLASLGIDTQSSNYPVHLCTVSRRMGEPGSGIYLLESELGQEFFLQRDAMRLVCSEQGVLGMTNPERPSSPEIGQRIIVVPETRKIHCKVVKAWLTLAHFAEMKDTQPSFAQFFGRLEVDDIPVDVVREFESSVAADMSLGKPTGGRRNPPPQRARPKSERPRPAQATAA